MEEDKYFKLKKLEECGLKIIDKVQNQNVSKILLWKVESDKDDFFVLFLHSICFCT